jgi:excinuclease UvrABC ATPase subunit
MRQAKNVPGGRCTWNSLDAERTVNKYDNRVSTQATPEEMKRCFSCTKPQSYCDVCGGLRAGNAGKQKRIDKEQFRQCYNKGMNDKQIARAIDAYPKSVADLRRRYGIAALFDPKTQKTRMPDKPLRLEDLV